ncbi:MAG: hypothetical protein ACYS9Y_07370 [Planctomycetota bacterium]|jgi:hypothetical protein
MAHVKRKSSLVADRPVAGNEMVQFTKHLSARQKSTVMKAAKVLARLSTSQKSAALALLQQRNSNGNIDYRWLTEFFTVLKKLKAEENNAKQK